LELAPASSRQTLGRSDTQRLLDANIYRRASRGSTRQPARRPSQVAVGMLSRDLDREITIQGEQLRVK
jgi:hypothetical protein